MQGMAAGGGARCCLVIGIARGRVWLSLRALEGWRLLVRGRLAANCEEYCGGEGGDKYCVHVLLHTRRASQ